ncbi:MAG: DUF2849 domain-containing protein [Pseudomonadota bacterium]
MSKAIPFPQILTANRLTDGIVVFWGHGDVWVAEIEEAQILQDERALSVARQHADATAKGADGSPVVVEIYGISVDPTAEVIVPVRLRERIRARGPTVSIALNRSRFSTADLFVPSAAPQE